MGIELIAFDLDGTLLRADKSVSPRSLSALVRAEASGIRLVPATGRIYSGMPRAVRDLPFRYAISSSLPNNIEVNSSRATKGNALIFLMEHLRIPAGDCMAFGDGSNDISLLQAAGTGVAMINGEKEVIAIAKRVAPSNLNDGLAQIVEEILP